MYLSITLIYVSGNFLEGVSWKALRVNLRQLHLGAEANIQPPTSQDIYLSGYVHGSLSIWLTNRSKWDGTISSTNWKWLIQVPFLRLIISGSPQVMIFFAISGYVLSYKPLKLARQGRLAEATNALSSSLVRRHARLFLPTAAISFLTAIATWLGCFQAFDLPGRPVAIPSRQPPRFDTLGAQLLHYFWSQVDYTNPFQDIGPFFNGKYIPYDQNLWTLPVEFRCSMVIFLWLFAVTRMPNRVRIMFSIALAWYTHWIVIDWSLFLFVSGVIVCDMHFEIESLSSPSKEKTTMPPWTRRRCTLYFKKCIGLASFVSAVYLLSMPYHDQGRATALGYMRLASLIPYSFNFIVPIAAVWLVFTVDQVEFLQVLFTNRFLLYMGKISFPLYLVHGPLLWTWGAFLGKACVLLVGQEILGIALAAALWWPIVILVADLTIRLVDAKCVGFIKWLYNKLEMKPIKEFTS